MLVSLVFFSSLGFFVHEGLWFSLGFLFVCRGDSFVEVFFLFSFFSPFLETQQSLSCFRVGISYIKINANTSRFHFPSQKPSA